MSLTTRGLSHYNREPLTFASAGTVAIFLRPSLRTLSPVAAMQKCNIMRSYRSALAQRPNDVDIAANLLSQEMLVGILFS